MGYTFKADGVAGTAIIYENSDNNPPTDPFTYRSRVLFYSGFRYPARVASFTGTITFASRGTGAVGVLAQTTAIKNLSDFGLSGPRLVEGKWLGIGTGGVDVPMLGSIPVQAGSNSAVPTNRWATLGCTTTQVVIHEMWGQAAVGGLSSLSLSYEVHILDEVLS
jgi:hypothetical protein